MPDWLPSAEKLAGYEHLGIVGILLLVLVVGIVLIAFIARRFSLLASRGFDFVQEQTKVLTEVRDSHEDLRTGINVLLARVDRLLECGKHDCPVRSLRMSQPSPPGATETAST